MKRYLLLLAAIVVAVGVTGCAGKLSRGEPDWVGGLNENYPDQSYLIGRGRAGSLEDAQNRARADLAKVFEVSIREQRRDEQRLLMGAGGSEGEIRESELEITRSLVTSTDQVVRGVRIAEIWRDPKTGEQHALAILPRTPAAMALRAEIRRLDEVTGLQVRRAREAEDILRRIAAARRALESQVERAGLQRALQVVEYSGMGVPPSWQTSRLHSDLEELLGRLRLAPTVSGSQPETLERALAGGIAVAGFTVGDGPEAHPLHATLRLDDLGLMDGWYWQRGILEVTLYDPAGRVRGTHRWPLKESARDRATAHGRIIDLVATILEDDLQEVLLDFAIVDH